MNWYLKCLKQYADFNGRARRKEFWMFTLFNGIISTVLIIISTVFGLVSETGLSPLNSLYSLIVFVPGLAVSVRRLHDVGKSGWYFLVGLIPILGWIYLIYLYVQEGEAGTNQYGGNPKELDFQ